MIGARLVVVRLLVRLVERMRVLPCRPGARTGPQPIDERDVMEYLARAPGGCGAAGRALDIAGPTR